MTSLSGRGFARFLAAGSYFLRKYRDVLNGLNVYPVPDGDTGTNMYFTVRSAAQAAYASRSSTVSAVAAAAAHGALVGARGNSGVILSQMLRGFAHHVRHRSEIDAFVAATALREAAVAARQALQDPIEGTIVSVADAAADAAYRYALHEPDLVRFLSGVLRFANAALDRTPEQLPSLKEAGVVDAGGAGFVYLLEGALAFLPEGRLQSTAFPRRPLRAEVFSPKQSVGVMRYCTEMVLEQAACGPLDLRRALEPRTESLLVVGDRPTLKVHVHTDDPDRVTSVAARFGTVTRVKIDDMAQQHRMLLVEPPAQQRSVVAVVPGPGFETIARELGAEVTLSSMGNPSIAELVLALNNCVSPNVYLFTNGDDAIAPAREAASHCDKVVAVVPTRNAVEGISGLIAARADGMRSPEAILRAAQCTLSARVFYEGKSARAVVGEHSFAGASIADVTRAAIDAMRRRDAGGLVTLYYGGSQREKDAQRLSEEVCGGEAGTEVEYYYGGMKNAEYWVAFDE